MQNRIKITFLLLIVASLVVTTGCSSSKKGQCGCPAKQGMIGYK